MNERIEMLAEQAMAKAVAKNFTGEKLELRMPSEAWAKEFVELIVRECIDLMGTNISGSFESDWDFDTQAKYVKKHFGIEQ